MQTPTSPSRSTKRRTFAAPRLRVAIARTVTVSACVPAFPPIDATIGISTASATKARMVSVNCEITVAARIAVQRLIASHTNRPRAISKTPSDSSSSPTPARQPDVLLRLLLQRLHGVVDGDDPDQPPVRVDDRRRGQVVLVEQVGHVLLRAGRRGCVRKSSSISSLSRTFRPAPISRPSATMPTGCICGLTMTMS